MVVSAGFTLVEGLVALGVVGLVLAMLHSFMSSGVRSSAVGQDQLESVRAASELFSQMRRDLLACQLIDTNGASVTIPVNCRQLPAELPYQDTVTFVNRNATTTYTMVRDAAGRGLVSREQVVGGVTTERRQFAVPRMRRFEAIQIYKDQRVKLGEELFRQMQLLVRIEVDSNDPRFKSRGVHLSSFFISSQLAATNGWNYFLSGW